MYLHEFNANYMYLKSIKIQSKVFGTTLKPITDNIRAKNSCREIPKGLRNL